ncbi:MAG: SPOR domain-containing protein [Burkholderiaceae bacterium]|jgi:hypothetical protein|nr:SPOR domain-containing protein [Burkholderiaceae bacterium]
MLRTLVLLLLLANGGYYAWSQGLLESWGFAPHQQAEPQRLQQQIRPELLRILPPEGGRAAQPSAPVPVSPRPPEPAAQAVPQAAAESPEAQGECLQAGIFDAAQAEVLRRAAAALPAGSWRLESATLPGRWMVYMGRFADADQLAKKRSELRELGVSFDRPHAALEPGLSLGRFSTEEAAQRGLTQLGAKGVRSARVVQERLDMPGFVLRLPQADAALRAQVLALRGALAGKDLRPCS